MANYDNKERGGESKINRSQYYLTFGVNKKNVAVCLPQAAKSVVSKASNLRFCNHGQSFQTNTEKNSKNVSGFTKKSLPKDLLLAIGQTD